MAQKFQGFGVSPGVAVGRVLVLQTTDYPVVPVPVPPERLDDEIAAFDRARRRAHGELTVLRDRIREALGERYAGILEAQLLILDDPGLVRDTTQRIRVGRVSAGWALKEVVGGFLRKLDAVDDGYLRERGGDLDDVHRRLQRLLRGEQTLQGAIPEGPHVVVAHDLGPSDTVAIAQHNALAVATDVGGPTSHTAILAQALCIPAVVGLHDLSAGVRTGDPIVVDGNSGRVVVFPDADELRRAQARREAWRARETEMASAGALPSVTEDGVEVTVRANIEFPQEVERAVQYGARGIGLYRSEFLFLSRFPDLPTEEDHYETYRKIGEGVAPHPTVIRTLDLGGEKYFHEVLDRDEANPVLGLRGVRFCLKRPDIFLPQLRGLLRAAAHADLRVMLPLVTSPLEIREVRELLRREAESLREEGHTARGELPLGVMIEVPAAALVADLLAREVDFCSVGTNDLIQYALAVDRGNDSVGYLYEPLHPAVLRMLRLVIDHCGQQGVPLAICGEMAADPSIVGLLIGLGLRDLSVQPRAIATVRQAIRTTHAAEMQRTAREVLEQESAAEVRSHLEGGRFIGKEPS